MIRAVTLSNARGWFDSISIPLNPGLISIIGQKGSGKSALAELIAFAAGSWHDDNAGSFLKRADGHLKGLLVEIEWADGAASRANLGSEQSEENQVRYLSQKFVERLCAEDHVATELVHEIESVIFSYLDPIDTLNASGFDELRAVCTEGVRAQGERLREEVIRLIREECDLVDNAAKLPEKRLRIKTLGEERAGLIKQLPKAASRRSSPSENSSREARRPVHCSASLRG